MWEECVKTTSIQKDRLLQLTSSYVNCQVNIFFCTLTIELISAFVIKGTQETYAKHRL